MKKSKNLLMLVVSVMSLASCSVNSAKGEYGDKIKQVEGQVVPNSKLDDVYAGIEKKFEDVSSVTTKITVNEDDSKVYSDLDKQVYKKDKLVIENTVDFDDTTYTISDSSKMSSVEETATYKKTEGSERLTKNTYVIDDTNLYKLTEDKDKHSAEAYSYRNLSYSTVTEDAKAEDLKTKYLSDKISAVTDLIDMSSLTMIQDKKAYYLIGQEKNTDTEDNLDIMDIEKVKIKISLAYEIVSFEIVMTRYVTKVDDEKVKPFVISEAYGTAKVTYNKAVNVNPVSLDDCKTFAALEPKLELYYAESVMGSSDVLYDTYNFDKDSTYSNKNGEDCYRFVCDLPSNIYYTDTPYYYYKVVKADPKDPKNKIELSSSNLAPAVGNLYATEPGETDVQIEVIYSSLNGTPVFNKVVE